MIDAAGEPWHECSSSAVANWPMSYGLQAEDAGSAVRWGASAGLTGWEVLHFTFESALGNPSD